MNYNMLLFQKAISLFYSNKFDEALIIFKQLLMQTDDKYTIAVINSLLGNIYLNNTKPDFNLANDCFSKAEKIFFELNKKDEEFKFQKAELLMDYGIYHKRMSNFDNAKDYYTRSLAIFKDLNSDEGIGRANHNIYILLSENNKKDSALPYLKNAIKYKSKLKKSIKNDISLLNSLSSLGNYFTKKKEFSQAELSYKDGIKLIKSYDYLEKPNQDLEFTKAGLYINFSNNYMERYYNSGSSNHEFIKYSILYSEHAKEIYENSITPHQTQNIYTYAKICYGLGMARTYNGSYERSEIDFKKSINLLTSYLQDLLNVSGEVSSLLADCHFSLGRLYYYNIPNVEKGHEYTSKAISLYKLNLIRKPEVKKFLDEAQNMNNNLKLFKKEVQIVENIWQNTRKTKRKCFHPNCEEFAIRSHYQQENGVLSNMSNDGTVWGLGWVPKGKGGYDEKYKYEFIKKSIGYKGELTTFCGFCNYHDSIIFDKIENKKFEPFDYSSREIQLLHAYRGVCNELHKVEYNVLASTSIIDNPNVRLLKEQHMLHGLPHKMKVRMTRFVKKQIEEDLYNNSKHFIFEHFELPRIEISTTTMLGPIPEFDNLNAENLKYWNEYIKTNNTIDGAGASNFLTLIPQDDTLHVIIGTNKEKKLDNFEIEKIANSTIDEKLKFLSDIILREIETWVISNKLYQKWKKVGWDKKVIDEINRHKPPTTILKDTKLNIFQDFI